MIGIDRGELRRRIRETLNLVDQHPGLAALARALAVAVIPPSAALIAAWEKRARRSARRRAFAAVGV